MGTYPDWLKSLPPTTPYIDRESSLRNPRRAAELSKIMSEIGERLEAAAKAAKAPKVFSDLKQLEEYMKKLPVKALTPKKSEHDSKNISQIEKDPRECLEHVIPGNIRPCISEERDPKRRTQDHRSKNPAKTASKRSLEAG
jgi:hypothetical protein